MKIFHEKLTLRKTVSRASHFVLFRFDCVWEGKLRVSKRRNNILVQDIIIGVGTDRTYEIHNVGWWGNRTAKLAVSFFGTVRKAERGQCGFDVV